MTVTAEQVRDWFVAATRRFDPPPLEDCALIAVQLTTLHRRDACKRARSQRATDAEARTARYGKLFLHHLTRLHEQFHAATSVPPVPTIRTDPESSSLLPRRRTLLPWRQTPRLATDLREGDPRRAVWRLTLAQIEMTSGAVEELLMYLEGLSTPGPDPIRGVAAAAQAAWAAANSGKAPTGVNADDPLVKFVAAALDAIGHRTAPATITDVLRARRRLGGARR